MTQLDVSSILPKYNIGEFPQPVSLLLFGQNSRGYIPATPDYIDIKFTGYVDTISVCCRVFSKSGVTPKCGPQGGSNFQVGSHCGPSGGQIYANIAILLRPFGRTLSPLKNAPYPGHHPLTQIVQSCAFYMIYPENPQNVAPILGRVPLKTRHSTKVAIFGAS